MNYSSLDNHSSQPKEFRNELLDIMRGIAILIVILGHALQGTHGGEVGDDLHRFILTFQMELMFAISGFSAVYSKKRTLADAVKRHLLRLGLPCLAWVWIFYLAEAIVGIKSWTMADAFGCVIISGFWFLRQLLLIYLAFEVYRHSGPISGILAGTLTLFAFACIPGQETLVHYAVWFVVGVVVHELWRYFLPNTEICNPLPRRLSVPLIWCGRNSLALYAVHWNIFFVFISCYLIDFSKIIEMSFPVAAFLMFALFTGGSVLLINMAKKFPLLPQLLFGEDWK